MKIFLFCVCVLVLASFSLADVKQHIKNAISSINEDISICANENDLVEDDWYDKSQIINNLHLQSGNERRTRKYGCTTACVMKKQNMMEGSNIKEIKIHETINRFNNPDSLEIGQLHKIIHKCVKEVKDITEECEKAISLYICITKEVYVAKHGEHTPEEKRDTES